MTNYHVVKGHEEFLLLCKDGQKIPTVIAAYDAANALVLLKVTESRKMPPALLFAVSAFFMVLCRERTFRKFRADSPMRNCFSKKKQLPQNRLS